MDEPDWQDAEVIRRTVADLQEKLQPWFDLRGVSLRGDQVKTALTAALAYAGEKADGYQMARWLEDSRSWPADIGLVGQLRHARDLLSWYATEIVKERKPPADSLIGLRFYLSPGPPHGAVFQVIELLPSGYYRIDRVDSIPGIREMGSENAIRRLIETYGYA